MNLNVIHANFIAHCNPRRYCLWFHWPFDFVQADLHIPAPKIHPQNLNSLQNHILSRSKVS